jgi:hypothetical protein
LSCFILQEVIPLLRKIPSVGEKLNWGLPQRAESSKDVHRFTGNERGLGKSETLTSNKESSALGVFMLSCTAVIPLLWERPVLVRSQTGDFHNVRDAVEISTDLLGMSCFDQQ